MKLKLLLLILLISCTDERYVYEMRELQVFRYLNELVIFQDTYTKELVSCPYNEKWYNMDWNAFIKQDSYPNLIFGKNNGTYYYLGKTS